MSYKYGHVNASSSTRITSAGCLMLNSLMTYTRMGGGQGAVPLRGADLPSATHLKDALFLNLLRFLTVSCGGGSFNLGSHHSLFVVTQTRQERRRVRRAVGSKRPSAVDSIATCCPEPALGSIRTAANGAPRPRKSMRAFVFGVATRRAGNTA